MRNKRTRKKASSKKNNTVSDKSVPLSLPLNEPCVSLQSQETPEIKEPYPSGNQADLGINVPCVTEPVKNFRCADRLKEFKESCVGKNNTLSILHSVYHDGTKESSDLNKLTDVNFSGLKNDLPVSDSSSLKDSVKSVITKVRNLRLTPDVYNFNLCVERGVSAIDMDKNMFYLAYSPSHSHEVRVIGMNGSSKYNLHGSVHDMWLKYLDSEKQDMDIWKEYAEAGMAKRRKMGEGSSSQDIPDESSCPEIYSLGHTAEVTGLRFTSDSSLLFSCSIDGNVRVINTCNHSVDDVINVGAAIYDIDISSNSVSYATGSALFARNPTPNRKHVAILHSLQRVEPINNYFGHKDFIRSIRFHSNGLYFATSSRDNTIKLWDTRALKEQRNFHVKGVPSPHKLAFSPDGKYLASTHSRCVKIWDLAIGKEVKCLETFSSDNKILNISYNDTGTVLAVGGSDKIIHLYDVTNNESQTIEVNHTPLKSENLDKKIFCIKFIANFFCCVTV